ncbi:MAG: rubredoxin [Kiritimatiellaceae bacterium]|nr:rubredoxin [Kiritimatiellaceae bacterium]
MKKWKCEACGYIHDGDEAPCKCPKCGAVKEQFTLLDDVAAKLVERSRHTNTLLSHVIDLSRQLEMVCNAGIKDELDPGCVDVFTKVRKMAWESMKLAMTEQQGHMKKGKWG